MATGAFESCTIEPNGKIATIVFAAPTPNAWGVFASESALDRPNITIDSRVPKQTLILLEYQSYTVTGGKLYVTVDVGTIYAGEVVTVTTSPGWITDDDGDVTGDTTDAACVNRSAIGLKRSMSIRGLGL